MAHSPQRDAPILREAATRIHQVALEFDLEADRVEVLDVMDEQAESMIAAARELLNGSEA